MHKAKKKLRQILLDRFDAKVQYNGVWFNIMCPFCGDSPNPNTRHCNIRVADDDDALIVHCFQLKCHASGIMNKNHLKDMGIFDSDIVSFVEGKKVYTQELIDRASFKVQEFDLPLIIPNDIELYFFNRTKIHLTESIIKKYRIVTSLEEFLKLNRKKLCNDTIDRILKCSKMRYIGFLNASGTNLEIRCIEPNISKDKRFLKISLVDASSHLRFLKHRPYDIEIDNDYDLESDGYIVLCEGKFDLINTVEHIMPNTKGIWVASTVSGLVGAVRQLTKLYPNRKIVYIADKDVTDNDIIEMMSGIWYRFKSLEVVRNELDKDVGDLSKPLSVVKYELKEVMYESKGINRFNRKGTGSRTRFGAKKDYRN